MNSSIVLGYFRNVLNNQIFEKNFGKYRIHTNLKPYSVIHLNKFIFVGGFKFLDASKVLNLSITEHL